MVGNTTRRFTGRNRFLYVLFAVLTVATGLIWRADWLPLTPFLEKYGADALWALMVFFGFGAVFHRMETSHVALISLGFAWAIEFSQLYKAPWIDLARSSRIAHLVLGSTFNSPDLIAYAFGVLCGAAMEWTRRHKQVGI